MTTTTAEPVTAEQVYAEELAKLALSLETAGALTPAMLDRHVVCADTLAGPDGPPAMEEKRARAATVGPVEGGGSGG